MFKNLNCLLSFRLVKVKAQNILKYMESGEVARAGRLCADQTAGGRGTAGKCTELLYVCTALLASVWAGTLQELGPAAIFGDCNRG
jgi:hypothetical protein